MTPPDVHSSAGIDRTAAAGMAQQEKRIGQHPSASLQAGFSFAAQKGEKRIAPAAAGKRTQRKNHDRRIYDNYLDYHEQSYAALAQMNKDDWNLRMQGQLLSRERVTKSLPDQV